MKVDWDFTELYEFADRIAETSKFESVLEQLTRKIAELLRQTLLQRTPVLTGNLREGWNAEENILVEVKKHGYGYSVTLYNRAMNNKSRLYKDFQYGVAVNDGHRKPNSSGWVMGKFFVEASVVETAESFELEWTIMRELEKWWKGCLNG